jgi:hypothetical protein
MGTRRPVQICILNRKNSQSCDNGREGSQPERIVIATCVFVHLSE